MASYQAWKTNILIIIKSRNSIGEDWILFEPFPQAIKSPAGPLKLSIQPLKGSSSADMTMEGLQILTGIFPLHMSTTMCSATDFVNV